MNKKILKFPDIQWWRQNVLMPTEQARFHKNHYYEYYLQKHIIALLYQPRRIAEIGVRWGYSAFSFLCASPAADYTGFDLINGGHGGAKENTFSYVDNLLKTFAAASIELHHQNTRALTKLPGKYDFIHVDGDHSTEGCLHDLLISWDALLPGGVILVDDDVKIEGVRRAINQFINAKHDLLDYYYRMPSLTGEVIIKKPITEKEQENG